MNKPKLEALKESGRWIFLFLASSLIMGIEAQIGLLPDFAKIGGVTFNVREILVLALALLGRGLDKYKHELAKFNVKKSDGKSHGLIPF